MNRIERMSQLESVGVIAIVWLGLGCMGARAQLPANFPAITVTAHDAQRVSPGYIFLASWSQFPGSGTYLMILDNDGKPVQGDKYRELLKTAGDFKMQPNGLLSYAQTLAPLPYTGGWDVEQKIVDDTLTNVLETIQMRNGYLAEFHDFQLLPNGNALIMGYYLSEVDLSQIVSGGNPGALVSGWVIQELDAQRNAVFQWRSWDHYNFENDTFQNPTASMISRFHLNDLNLDVDGNLIAGTPTEIRKINRQNGEVMWTLGGPLNEFTIVGAGVDADDFGGHGAYRLPNGNFLSYDNSHGTVTSRALEYCLDETNKVATLVWSYTPPTTIAGRATGYAQRLPNGNTFICWGIPRNANVPICTEVTPAGEKVFELTFNNTSIQSYRAFRFPYPAKDQKIESTRSELSAGNTYAFTNTGVSVAVLSGGGGYNSLTVTREAFAPVYPLFQGKAPLVLPMRLSMAEFAIGTMRARIAFDTDNLGLANPTNLTVYYRARAGTGLFLPQTTDYNPSTKELRVTLTLNSQSGEFGEFIFGYPDVADVPYPPLLAQVENYRGVKTNLIIAPKRSLGDEILTVNQELPILLSWSPKGFARWYEFQISDSPDFASPLVTVPYQTEAFHVWSNAAPDTTYFFRVRTWNEGGESDWSMDSFQTIAPTIAVTFPNGGESLQPGLTYFISWKDNVAENVVIDLYKNGVFQRSLVTNASTGSYRWEVGLGLVPGNDYSIKISSTVTGTLFDSSDLPFSIGAPIISGIRQEQDGSWVLEWTGSSSMVYIEFSPTLDPAQWQTIAGPVGGSSWTTSEQPAPQGFYRLRLE